MAKSTKAQILQHFSELLKDHELDKITVTLLVSECEISRQTFYYHFNDIQALINWGIKQYTAGCLENVKSAKDINEATIIYLSAMEENRFYLSKCLESSLSGYTTLLIRESICEYITFFGNKILGISSLEPTDSKFVVEFLANAVTGLIISSIYKKEEMDIKFVSEKIEKIILGKIIK
ncbi:MAG: TetR family transcriptional regulator [Eubacterium sp.]|nr:TetR family transcriptional regulator [Eubacterium sp.]